MFLLSDREELWSPAHVAGRVDVDVAKGVVGGDANFDAGDLGPPEEVPVLFDFELLIPADGLQNVAVGDEAVADVVAAGDGVVPAVGPFWDVQNSILQCPSGKPAISDLPARGGRAAQIRSNRPSP